MGAQNNDIIQNKTGARNNGVIQNETGTRNNGVIQNETDAGQSRDIGRPQGHAPTVATMILNDAGKMVETEWSKLSERFPNIELYRLRIHNSKHKMGVQVIVINFHK